MLSTQGEAAAIAALQQIQGASFAGLDAVTHPKTGIKKVTTNQQVLLFGCGGQYESMVKKRLEEAGLNPGSFAGLDLPWGTRVDDSPLISHKEKLYLQTILIQPGGIVYYRETPFGDREVNPLDYGIKERTPNQGLPEGQEVVVNTYGLDNLVRLTVGGLVFT